MSYNYFQAQFKDSMRKGVFKVPRYAVCYFMASILSAYQFKRRLSWKNDSTETFIPVLFPSYFGTLLDTNVFKLNYQQQNLYSFTV